MARSLGAVPQAPRHSLARRTYNCREREAVHDEHATHCPLNAATSRCRPLAGEDSRGGALRRPSARYRVLIKGGVFVEAPADSVPLRVRRRPGR